MTDEPRECAATPSEELRRQIMSWSEPKNEREWWALRHIEEIEAALAEREREIARQGWQPIKTAPKDGTEILAWYCGGRSHAIVSWHGGWVDSGDGVSISTPSHWTPLRDGPDCAALSPTGESASHA